MTAEELKRLAISVINVAQTLEVLFQNIQELGNIILSTTEAVEAPKKRIKKAEAPALPEPKTLSLEDVRMVLAEKSRAGHTAEVKELISKYGAEKLSDIKPDDYEAILAEAEVIPNE